MTYTLHMWGGGKSSHMYTVNLLKYALEMAFIFSLQRCSVFSPCPLWNFQHHFTSDIIIVIKNTYFIFIYLSPCAMNSYHKGPFINNVKIILAIFDPHVRVRKILRTSLPYSYVKFHFVFRHNKMLLEKDHVRENSQFDVNQNK